MVELEHYRERIRESAPCPRCSAKRNQRCNDGRRKRNHIEREQLFRQWCDEQAEAERLDEMLGRMRRG